MPSKPAHYLPEENIKQIKTMPTFIVRFSEIQLVSNSYNPNETETTDNILFLSPLLKS